MPAGSEPSSGPATSSPSEVSFPELQRLVAEGTVEKVGPGPLPSGGGEAETSSRRIAMVASAIPTRNHLPALRAAHPRDRHPGATRGLAGARPQGSQARQPPARLRIVRFSGAMLTYGVRTHSILGVRVRVTSPARTVVDCFRYRTRSASTWRLKRCATPCVRAQPRVDEIMRAAEVCRARTIMRTYLEALSP